MVSAIILAYNRCSEALFTIDRLKELRRRLVFNLEIIVVDNGSADNTSKLISEMHPDITLITKPENNGIAGWNEGFKIAKEPYLLVLDDDSHIESGLEEAVAYLQSHKDVGILALNITGGSFETSKWLDKAETIGFIGCGAIIRREVFQNVGGFAEWLHVYAHEWEYGIRVMDASYKIVYFKNSNVVHRTSKLNRTPKRLLMFSTRNEIALVYKHFARRREWYALMVWLNSLKVLRVEGVIACYYAVLGGIKFLGFRSQLQHTPVSIKTQQQFTNVFWGTRPLLGSVSRKLKSLVNHTKTKE